MKEYFSSFGVELIFNMYNLKNFVYKPYIYDKPELYNKSKSVEEFYYQIPIEKEKEQVDEHKMFLLKFLRPL